MLNKVIHSQIQILCLLRFSKVVRLDLSIGSKVDTRVDMVAAEEV